MVSSGTSRSHLVYQDPILSINVYQCFTFELLAVNLSGGYLTDRFVNPLFV